MATLLSGTTIAQVVTLAMTIPLARLYGPEQFGFFAIIQSVVAVGVTIASLRYDMAIVLPKTDLEGRVVQKLASRSVLVMSLLFSLVLLAASGLVAAKYSSQLLAYSLVASGLVVYTTAQIANRQFWLTRKTRFGVIASNRVIGSVSTGVFQVLAALFTRSFLGLLVGLILGQILTLILVNSRVPDLRSPIHDGAPSTLDMARRYKKMPLLNGPNAILDSVRTAGINVLIGNIAVAGLGQYSMAYRVTGAPAGLISGAISQVFLQKMSVTVPGEMTKLVRSVLIRIGFVSLPAFTILYFAAPWFLPFLFGREWMQSGLLAQALIPWIFMLTFTSPLSNLFIVAERQGTLLGFAVLYAAAPLTFLTLAPWGLVRTVQGLGLVMAGCLLVMLALAILVARGFDRRPHHG
ncbi:oligosaccharide flippase family protein [Schaalia sp. JY-X159]|uniref:oligosaccharide flippase family protein n=1 Tax=Schaalia sp. JY-X159 TaxID=2758575 RepID=UPI00165D9426|nr:oligosaccharide flippase family protein [Schaalia sp. JY-X159]